MMVPANLISMLCFSYQKYYKTNAKTHTKNSYIYINKLKDILNVYTRMVYRLIYLPVF